MEPEPGNRQVIEGVLCSAAARGPDGALYLFPRMVARGNYSRIGIARVQFNKEPDLRYSLSRARDPPIGGTHARCASNERLTVRLASWTRVRGSWRLSLLQLLHLLRVLLLQLLRLLLVSLLHLLRSRVINFLFCQLLVFLVLFLLEILPLLLLFCYEFVLLLLVFLIQLWVSSVGSSWALDSRQFLRMDGWPSARVRCTVTRYSASHRVITL